MIAYLSDLGILASSMWQWVLPENTKVPGVAGQAVPRMIPIDLADPYTEHRVAAALEAVYLRRSDAIISRQDGASQGSGVEPLDWTLPRLLTTKFRSQPRLLSGMRALWQGALPTSSKTRQRVCPACKVPADLDHILWHCQWWTAVEGTVPPEFQAWRKKWTHPAIWTRGVAPTEDVTIRLPPAAFQLTTTGQWDCLPEEAVVGTDATGGPNSSEPSLRLVTAGAVAAVSPEEGPPQVVATAAINLPIGATVVQGEAFALGLAAKLSAGQVDDLTADCQPAIRQAEQGAPTRSKLGTLHDAPPELVEA